MDFSGYDVGDEVTLVNRLGSGSTAQVMRFVVVRRGRDDSAIPDRLTEIERLDPARAVISRDWRFTRTPTAGQLSWVINGRKFAPTRMTPRHG